MSDLQNIRAMWLKWDELNSAEDFKTSLSKSYFLQGLHADEIWEDACKVTASSIGLPANFTQENVKLFDHLTRKSNNSKRIQKNSNSTNLKQFTILYQGPKIWNSLPTSVTRSSNLFIVNPKTTFLAISSINLTPHRLIQMNSYQKVQIPRHCLRVSHSPTGL